MGNIHEEEINVLLKFFDILLCSTIPPNETESSNNEKNSFVSGRLAYLSHSIKTTTEDGAGEDQIKNLLSQKEKSIAVSILEDLLKKNNDSMSSSLCKNCYEISKHSKTEDNIKQTQNIVFNLFEPPGCCCCITDEWKFIYFCVCLLKRFTVTVSVLEPDSSCPLLSVKQEKVLNCMIQSLLALGICQNLLKGVGMPLTLRLSAQGSNVLSNLEPKRFINERHLLIVCKVLYSSVKCKLYGPKFIVKCLGDIIGTLIQLSCRPISEVETKNATPCACFTAWTNHGTNVSLNEGNVTKSTVCVTCIFCQRLCDHERKQCEYYLTQLIQTTYKPLVVRELISLQRTYPASDAANKKLLRRIRPPKWLNAKCGELLSRIILEKNGVKSVIMGMFEGLTVDSLTWEKCEMIGNVIYQCPSQIQSIDEYHKNICPQLLELLKKSPETSQHQIAQIVFSYICLLDKNLHLLAEIYFFRPLIIPLISLADNDNPSVSEQDLLECITSIHQLMYASPKPIQALLDTIFTICHPLFEIYAFCWSGISIIKKLSKDILTVCLNLLSLDGSKAMLYSFAFGNIDPYINSISNINQWQGQRKLMKMFEAAKYLLSFGEDGGVNIKCRKNSLSDNYSDGNMDNYIVGSDVKIGIILELLGHIERSDDLKSEFLLILLEEFSVSLESSTEINEVNNLGMLDFHINRLQYNILLVSTIAAMCDKYADSVTQNTSKILDFVDHTLRRCATRIESSNHLIDSTEDDLNAVSDETISTALGLVSVMVNFSKEDLKKHSGTLRMIKSLELIASNKRQKENASLAQELNADLKSIIGSIIEPLIEHSKEKGLLDNPQQIFLNVLKDARSSLIPTQGHGLIQLTRLLSENDSIAWDRSDEILSLCIEKINQEDSYIYMSAIRCMVALVRKKHSVVIPTLARQINQLLSSSSQADKDNEEYHKLQDIKLKVIEALVQAARYCGNLVPRYSQIFLASLLRGVHDEDEAIRASCLSAIADVCKLLRFSIGPVLYEVTECICSVLRYDQSPAVRKAALTVITLLLEGLGRDAIEALGDTLKDLYGILKVTHSKNDNPSVQYYCEKAFGVLDDVMRTLLFPKQPFENIKI